MPAHTPKLSYWTVQPNRWTFEAPKISDWVESRLTGRVLNMCAGPTELDHDGEVLRNDLNLSIDADTNVAACALVDEYAENSFDVLVYDPAFSDNQAEETYNISDSKIDLGEIHETIDALLKPGGILIHFGFGSSVMPATYQYEPQEIALWNNLGGQYDWLSCVTRKPTSGTAPAPEPSPIAGEVPTVTAHSDVYPNAMLGAATRSTAATSGGNNDTAISFDYYRFPAGTELRPIVDAHLDAEVTGRTLDLCHTQRSLTNTADHHRNALTSHLSADSHHAPQRLSNEFADTVFDTVVMDPEPSAFQRHTSYYGRDKVEATVLKLEAHPLLRSGANIIQVAHTATCMRSELNYTRTNIAVFSTPSENKDIIVTTDRKDTDSYADALTRIPEDATVPDEISTAPIRHVCVKCGEGYYLKHKTGVGSLTVRNWGGHSRTDSVLRIPRSSDLQYEYRRDFVSPYSFTHAAVYHGV